MPKSFSNPKDSLERELCYLNPWARYIEVDMTRDIQLCKWDENGNLISHEEYNIRKDESIDPKSIFKGQNRIKGKSYFGK